MKKIILMMALAGTCFYAAAQNKESAQNKDAKAQEDAMNKAWMAYSTPGPMHEMMAKSNGEWTADVTMWMAPGTPPTRSTGTCTNRMIMGNRYQESIRHSTFNNMPFEGTGICGYDNAKKVFVNTWIDNMGTGIMYTEGKYDEKTKTILFTGKTVDPMTGKEIAVREVFKMLDDNNQTLEMFMTQNGKEFRTLEIKFTRKM